MLRVRCYLSIDYYIPLVFVHIRGSFKIRSSFIYIRNFSDEEILAKGHKVGDMVNCSDIVRSREARYLISSAREGTCKPELPYGLNLDMDIILHNTCDTSLNGIFFLFAF